MNHFQKQKNFVHRYLVSFWFIIIVGRQYFRFTRIFGSLSFSVHLNFWFLFGSLLSLLFFDSLLFQKLFRFKNYLILKNASYFGNVHFLKRFWFWNYLTFFYIFIFQFYCLPVQNTKIKKQMGIWSSEKPGDVSERSPSTLLGLAHFTGSALSNASDTPRTAGDPSLVLAKSDA